MRIRQYYSIASGLLGMLYKDENHRGKGYAKLVTQCLQKEVAKMGFDIYGAIDKDNVASRSLQEKLGSEAIDTISKIICKRN